VIAEQEEIQIENSAFIGKSNSKIKLLTLKHRKEWWAYLKKMPGLMQNVYYSPEYYEVYEQNGDGSALCFVCNNNDKLALYPFLLENINRFGYKLDKDYFDICGAYGYNGVLYNSDEPEFIKGFYRELNECCKNNNIIAEFTRFNPILSNQRFSDGFLDISYNRRTVYIDLSQSYESIYKNYSHSAKSNLKKAVRNNLRLELFDKEFTFEKEFVLMYKETMDRVNALDHVYFSDTYFENTFNGLPIVNFVVFKDSIPIASALCLTSKNTIHVHFEVSKSNYLIYRPNNFLFNEIIKYSINKGFKILHFGGGRTNKIDDALLRFKKNFSKSTAEFYTGAKIHDEEVYNQVCNQWKLKYPHLVQKYDDKFLKYRFLS
jgi:hypothetical protein